MPYPWCLFCVYSHIYNIRKHLIWDYFPHVKKETLVFRLTQECPTNIAHQAIVEDKRKRVDAKGNKMWDLKDSKKRESEA